MKTIASSLFILLFLLVGCSLLGSDGGSGPRLEGLPGKVVYSAEQGDETHLFITNQEGTRQLTSSQGAKGGDYTAADPAFSPDGTQVVYISNRVSSFAKTIYIINADGSNQTPLTNASGEPVRGENPVFSPDGKKVAFNRAERYEPFYENNDIYIMDLASHQVRKLTQNTAHDIVPTWSPDEKKIAFASGRDYEDAEKDRFRKDLYMVNIDGSNVKRLTKKGNVSIPRWAPMGSFIAYTWQSPDRDIYLLNLDSSSVTKITNLKAVGAPIWNNGGNQLLIPGTTNGGKHVLQMITRDGKVQNQIELSFDGTNFDWYNQ